MSKKRKSPRRLNKAEKELAVKQIREMFVSEVDDMRNEITDRVAEYAQVAASVAVMDIFGVTGEKMVEFNQKFLAQFDCIVAGTVSLDDLKGLLEVEAFTQIVDVKEMRDSDVPILVGAGNHRCICWQGETGSISYWAKRYGLKGQTVRGRLANGWDVKRALTTPTKGAVQK